MFCLIIGDQEFVLLYYFVEYELVLVGEVVVGFGEVCGLVCFIVLMMMECLCGKGYFKCCQVCGVYCYSIVIGLVEVMCRVVGSFVEKMLSGLVLLFVVYLFECVEVSDVELVEFELLIVQLQLQCKEC